jgi:8-oxo-dGTP pyrophosphatase MutT (NUDIX family)
MEKPIRYDYSAGGVAYRLVGEETPRLEIALIATKGQERWQLPKGTIERGESARQTAVREVAEETGIETECQLFLKTVNYTYYDTYHKDPPIRVHKQVDFYLLKAVGGQLNDDSYEVDGVGWYTPEDALAILTFSGERAVVEAAMEHWT